MTAVVMRPLSGEFLLNGVRVGHWHETASGVVHAYALAIWTGQCRTYEEAEALVLQHVHDWLASVAAP